MSVSDDRPSGPGPRRCGLEATSRGLLVIAVLLTPVCQLALTLPGHGGTLETVLPLLSLPPLGFLLWRAARVLTPHAPATLTLSVVLMSLAQVAAVRLPDNPSGI